MLMQNSSHLQAVSVWATVVLIMCSSAADREPRNCVVCAEDPHEPGVKEVLEEIINIFLFELKIKIENTSKVGSPHYLPTLNPIILWPEERISRSLAWIFPNICMTVFSGVGLLSWSPYLLTSSQQPHLFPVHLCGLRPPAGTVTSSHTCLSSLHPSCSIERPALPLHPCQIVEAVTPRS